MTSRKKKVLMFVFLGIFALGVLLPTVDASPVPALVGVPIGLVAFVGFAVTAVSIARPEGHR